MRISDWSSDVCSSDLVLRADPGEERAEHRVVLGPHRAHERGAAIGQRDVAFQLLRVRQDREAWVATAAMQLPRRRHRHARVEREHPVGVDQQRVDRSEEHTSELQSLMRISYAVFCLKKKNNTINNNSAKTQYY